MKNNNHETNNYNLSFIGALELLFIGLKLCGVINWSWWWVLSPIWMSLLLILLIIILIIIFTR